MLGRADALWLTEVYAAGEAPIAGADGAALSAAVRAAGRVQPAFVADVATLPRAIGDAARGGDVVITMGAGSIGQVPQKLVSMAGTA